MSLCLNLYNKNMSLCLLYCKTFCATFIYMKRKSQTAFLFLFISMPLFSSSFTFSNGLSRGIEASDNELGKIVSENKTDLVKRLEISLDKEFSPTWIENFVSKDNLYGFSKSYSSQLASILPLNNPFYFIAPNVSKSETQITIRCLDKRIITFIFDNDENLVALTVKQS